MDAPLSDSQVNVLADALHLGAGLATEAMEKWLAVQSMVEIDSVDQLPISDAAEVLGGADDVLCFCSMDITGALTGQLILGFGDQSGLSLSDLLLDRDIGTATEWNEVEQSAALETMNIVGCAYLNSLAVHLRNSDMDSLELLPSPPTFRRDFAESLLQSAFLGQATASDFVFLARAKFQIRGESLDWTLLFVPDAPSIACLRELIDHAI